MIRLPIRWLRWAALLVVLHAGQGCGMLQQSASGGDAVFAASLPEPTVGASPASAAQRSPRSVAPVPDGVSGEIASAASDSDYRIGPLDVLEIAVFGVPELARTVRVSATGQIALPLIGAVVARGKTAAELESEIAKKLGATYLQAPDVSVAVKEATSQRITVTGAVKQPGVFPLTGPTTLLQTIAVAGGLDSIADARSVVVFRYSGGQRMAARFDVSAIGAGDAPDPIVAAGDVVMVDQSGTRATLRDIIQNLPIVGFFVPLLLL